MLKSTNVDAYNVKPNLNKTNVSSSLLSDEAIEIQAKKMTTFPEMSYPNKMMEIQCGYKYNEGAKWARDILINQIASEPVINNSLLSDVDYWKQRCLAAEKFIKESPCDPDIHEDQIIAYKQWQDIVNCNDR
jgi:hypothetical protein